VDPDTLLPVDHPTSGLDLRVLVACRFGRARLIDNLGVVAG
jgi:pantothenate synthetase